VFDPAAENVVSLPTNYTLYVWSADSDTWHISRSLQTALFVPLSESLAIIIDCSSRSATDLFKRRKQSVQVKVLRR